MTNPLRDRFGIPVRLNFYTIDELEKIVSRGARVASFMWIQSLVREDARRTLLFDMDMNIQRLRERHGDTEELVGLTSTYHNLLRLWAEV